MSGAGNSKVGLWNPETEAETMNADGSINIGAASLPLPAGAATEATLAKLTEWGLNDLEEASATVSYAGYEKSTGEWNIIKIDTTSGYAIGWATVLNNPTVTSYSDAFTARATLTYNDYASAF
jgi:hypothetical protein